MKKQYWSGAVSGTSWRSSAVSVRPLISASLSLIRQVRPSISASISSSLCDDCDGCSSGGGGSKDSEAAGSMGGACSSVALAILGSFSSVGARRACASGRAEAGSDRAPTTAPSGTIGSDRAPTTAPSGTIGTAGVARVVFMRRGSVPACACPAAGARIPACACARGAASGCARDGACTRVAATGCARALACLLSSGCILSLGCIRGGSVAILG